MGKNVKEFKKFKPFHQMNILDDTICECCGKAKPICGVRNHLCRTCWSKYLNRSQNETI